jgi:ssDNA-binding Zn-finger/Zn-ribbon topoisomerase 1
MACTNDECKNTRKILRNGEVAPPKEDPVPLPELPCEKSDAYFVLRDGAAGVFLAANTFPKSRETRAPLVEELHRFRDRLPEKLRYLADAPQTDAEGNKTMVRFSRKTKQQYVSSEKDGKATGWSASCTIEIRRCLRMRSTSSLLKAGCRATSASNSIAWSVVFVRELMPTEAESIPAPEPMPAPICAAALAISVELRVAVPSVSRRAEKLARPGLSAGLFSPPASDTRFALSTGSSCSSVR